MAAIEIKDILLKYLHGFAEKLLLDEIYRQAMLLSFYYRFKITRTGYSSKTSLNRSIDLCVLQTAYKTLAVNNFLCLRGVYASGKQDAEPRKIIESVEEMDQILALIYYYIYFLHLKKRHSMSITNE